MAIEFIEKDFMKELTESKEAFAKEAEALQKEFAKSLEELAKETEAFEKDTDALAKEKKALMEEKEKKKVLEKKLEEAKILTDELTKKKEKEKEAIEAEKNKKKVLEKKMEEAEMLRNVLIKETAEFEHFLKKAAVKKKRMFPKCCWFCGQDEGKLYKCSWCQKAYYCNKNCVEKDWPVHGGWCTKKKQKREERKIKNYILKITKTQLERQRRTAEQEISDAVKQLSDATLANHSLQSTVFKEEV